MTIMVTKVSHRSKEASRRLVHLYRGSIVVAIIIIMVGRVWLMLLLVGMMLYFGVRHLICLRHLIWVACKANPTRRRRCFYLTLPQKFLVPLHRHPPWMLHVTAAQSVNICLLCIHRSRIVARRHHS